MAPGPPPPGPQLPLDPDYARQTNLPLILGLVTTFQFLAVAIVATRIYVRIKFTKSFGRDDWTMGAAVLCALGGWALFVFQGVYGLGRHKETLDANQMAKIDMGKFLFSIISSSWGIALLKISIALNLLRLSTDRWFVWSLWASIVFVSLYSFLGMFPFLLYCRPVQAYWDKSIAGAKCYPVKLFIAFGLVNTSLNIFTDVLFASFPIPIVWKLQMKRRAKWHVVGVLGIGYVAVVLGILKSITQINFDPFADNYYETWVTVWATIQLNVGILAACAPSLRPLIAKALKLTTRGRSNPSGYGSGSRQPRSNAGTRDRPFRSRQDEYGMEALQSRGGTPRDSEEFTTNKKAVVKVSVYERTDLQRTSSEEMIISEPPAAYRNGTRIMKTTEYSVR